MQRVVCLWLLASLATVTSAWAEEPGRIRGVVRTMPSNETLPEASVSVVGTGLKATTDTDGNYEITQVPPGKYQVRFTFPDHKPMVLPAEVAPGATVKLDAGLTMENIPGEEIVVVGSKFPEKRLDAPATVETVRSEDIQLQGASTYMAALAKVKGVDFADYGVGDKRISARGFNTQFNSRMLFMVDGRLAMLPGNGLPQGMLLPTPSLDIYNVEVAVGPASALYGANAHTGVVNIITKTPWDDSGATIQLRAGNQNLLDGSLRVAGTINKNFGYKVNAQFMKATDFAPSRDQKEFFYGPASSPIFEADLLKNYDISSAKAEGFLYYRLGDWNFKGGYGFSDNTGFSATNTGRNHLRDWQVQYETLQVSHPNWFAQFTRTQSDGGRTYQIDALATRAAASGGVPADPADLDPVRDQIRFIDKSQLLDSEVQYRNEFGPVKATAGLQFREYLPVSEGTYLADVNGVKISATEFGGYAQGDFTVIPDKLRVVGAARVDTHTDYAVQFSPKLAVVYKLDKNQDVRVDYNRAFKSPTILENYLKIGNTFLGNKTGFVVKDAAGNVVSDIHPLVPEQVDSVEVGYKGTIANKLYLDAVAYHSWYNNFIGPLTSRANPAAGTYAYYPDGAPVAAGTSQEGALLTYSNFGRARVAGLDVGADYSPIPEISLYGAVSYIKMLSFTNSDPTQKDLLLNVPDLKLRGSVTLQDLGIKNSFLRLSGRYQNAYRFASGRWVSDLFYPNGLIPARFVADLALGYKLKNGFTISGNVYNLFNDHGIDVLGAPQGGLTAFLQVEYHYQGLDF